MFVVCWSPKGGVGTSVVAAALAVSAARRGERTVLVDLDGDQPALLGTAVPGGEGVGEWVAAGDDVPLDALAELEVDVDANLRLLPRGTGSIAEPDRLALLASVLAGAGRTVVVDAGGTWALRWWGARARSVLVLRNCYLAARRVGRSGPATELVVVEEPGRALRSHDIEAATGATLRCRLPLDPAVARAVDAGTFVSRLPRSLRPLTSS